LDDEDYEVEGSYVYIDPSLQSESEDELSEDQNAPVDPRWELLKKLKTKE
jgi:uncharacterized metal-binding protein YceD (DUF177 family)